MMMLFVICTSSSPCVTPCRFPPGGRLLAFNGPRTDLLRPKVPLQDGVVDDDDDNNEDHDDDDNNNQDLLEDNNADDDCCDKGGHSDLKIGQNVTTSTWLNNSWFRLSIGKISSVVFRAN